MTETVTIEALGHRGDGLAQTSKGRVFVPFTLDGERVEISGTSMRRNLVKVLQPSPDRIAPICEYFGSCGGCQVQHFSLEPYLAWKQNIVADALAVKYIETELKPVVFFENDKRRRAVFAASHSSNGVIFGFSKKASHNIANINNCPVIAEPISSSIEIIKKIIRPVLPAKGSTSIHVLECDNGLDIHIEADGSLNEKNRQSAVRYALEEGIARLSFGGETLIETKRPTLAMGIAHVSPPPGTFVQAMAAAEREMATLVCDHLKDCKKTADLFCGIGTFALRLAEHSNVFASENNQPALDALDEAWRATGGKLKTVKTERRDLFVRPVMADELKKIQGVVFDPPRMGGQVQAQQLARSKCKKIAAVSCNPVSLARDLAILIAGGFKLVSATPIDQFVFTPHVEVVVLLER